MTMAVEVVLQHSGVWHNMAKEGFDQTEQEEFIKDMLDCFQLQKETLEHLLLTCDISILNETNFVVIWSSLNFYDMDTIYDHLDIVKYLYEKQHKICDKSAIYYAKETEHWDVVIYWFHIQFPDTEKQPYYVYDEFAKGPLY